MTTPAARSGTRLVRPLPRQLSRLLVLVLLTLAAGVGLAGTAAAHNVLTSSDPTDGSTLQAAPTTVRLTFDQPVQDFQPVVAIIGPDGNRYESGAPVVDSTVVTASVGALPVAGSYSVAYRIVSADGHPVEGEIKFELAEGAVAGAGTAPATAGAGSASEGSPGVGSPTADPPAGSSSARSVVEGSVVEGSTPEGSVSAGSGEQTPSSTSEAAVTPTAASSGLSGWVWAAIAVAGILVAAAIVVIVRRPTQQ